MRTGSVTTLLFFLCVCFSWGEGASWADEPSASSSTRNFRVNARSYGTQLETEPPRYVRNAGVTGVEALQGLDWLDIGFELRHRYEYRNSDLRRSIDTNDELLLWRTRAYIGVKKILDPLRVTIEFQDSRRNNSQFPADDRDVNEFDFIQAYGELYFEDALGGGRPVSIRLGRMAFEVLDRRLIARNEWRNTTNAFQGARVIFGKDTNDRQLEMFLLNPLRRELYDADRINDHQQFFGAIGSWRQWSEHVTLQPFYLGLHQDAEGEDVDGRMVHSPGMRMYGPAGETGIDYDAQVVYQFGHSGSHDHRAFGSSVETGYTFEHPWNPRASASYGYASGDVDPNDDDNERFERFFGFARPWSNNDYFQWENIHAPKVRLEAQPTAKLRLDTGYSWYWLASDTDRWNNAGLRDESGQSGDFIGQEVDLRVRYRCDPRLDLNVGYAYFRAGEFTKNTGRDRESHFVYVELVARAFE